MTQDLIGEPDLLQTPSNTDTSVKDVVQSAKPHRTSVAWNDYVLSLFDPSELADNLPLVAGLRRVAELEIGEIMFSGPTQVYPSSKTDGTGQIAVVWQVVFETRPGVTKVFSDLADCNHNNTDDKMMPFAVAFAGTRAEARALRKALGLKTIAFEEGTSKDTAAAYRTATTKVDKSGEYDENSRMTDAQANYLAKKAKQLKINVAAFLETVMDVDPSRVSKQMASQAIEKIDEFQKGEIPTEIQGFKEDWRK